jgi:hypothetical protein
MLDIQVFSYMTPCPLVNIYRRFREAFCTPLRLASWRQQALPMCWYVPIFNPEDKGSIIPLNVRNYLPVDKT